MISHLYGGTSISYDGLPSVNDLHRLNVLGQGTSDRVIHTLRRFDQAGYPYGIRVTVTADNLANLPDSIEFICTEVFWNDCAFRWTSEMCLFPIPATMSFVVFK